MVDEMDLLASMKAVEPLRPRAFEDARVVLRAAMAMEEGTRETKTAARRRARWGTGTKVGFGAFAVGAVAAAAAVALVATSTSAPRPAAPPVSASQGADGSPLLTLAAYITANSPAPIGDASLIIRAQTIGNHQPDISYNLYGDNGTYYAGGDRKSLTQAVDQHQNMANGIDSVEVKTALQAASGNLATARMQMATALPGDQWLALTGPAQKAAYAKVLADRAKIYKIKGVKNPPAHLPMAQDIQLMINNRVWNNSVDALSAGAGRPQVRAGVLRLLSTIPGVTVVRSSYHGQPTLTITAGSAVFGQGYGEQVLTINAKTGMPVTSVFPAFGKVAADVQIFQVSRVTLARVAAGKY
jgi:hypothetical protein